MKEVSKNEVPVGITSRFGFYPCVLDLQCDEVSIGTLDGHDSTVESVRGDPTVVDGWIYSGAKKNWDFINDTIVHMPYSSRVFGLPKTHWISFKGGCNEDVDFVVWCVSFFTGMRLTTTEAGFLDSTPIKPGCLVDFVLSRSGLEKALDLSVKYLRDNSQFLRARKRVSAVIHALFLAQNPQNLPFERFQYLYMALDACFSLISESVRTGSVSHAQRIEWMCDVYGLETPGWAKPKSDVGDRISTVRNDAFHEAIFFGEPLGFSIYGGERDHESYKNVPLQMQALISRLLVAILGSSESEYVKSPVDTRQKYELDIK
ncbi:hypothetical protein [Halomonas elongata]|uniref:hypothetical protein n=1 Tax=Halomonas elongata TaxID=2746 RepID=UPI00403403BB